MEALKIVALTPPSVLSRKNEPRKSVSAAPVKNQSFHSVRISSRAFLHGSLALLSSSLANSDLAKALTYEEALQQSVNAAAGDTPFPDFDIGGIFGNFASFAVDNALIIGGGAVSLAVPLVVARLIGSPKAWGVVNAKSAYEKLGDDPDAQLVDIRAPADVKRSGSPDVRGLKKKPVSVEFNREDKSGFLNRLGLKFKDPENTTLFILDKFDGNSELVAELATTNGFKAAYAIRDGAEGSRGWLNSGLPWILPKKAFIFGIGSLVDTISDTFGVASDAIPLALGTAVATVVGLLTYTEVESVLQLVGSVALLQLVAQNVVVGENRKRTVQEIEEFVNTQIAPKDLPGDIKKIGLAFLPSSISEKALPASLEASPDSQQKVEAAPTPTPKLNSTLQAKVVEDSLSGLARPLSPYPNYPDYKPPSSPMPSQP